MRETQRELSAALERHEQELAANAQELQALRTENVELKRLVAKQHGQLSNLIGSDTTLINHLYIRGSTS